MTDTETPPIDIDPFSEQAAQLVPPGIDPDRHVVVPITGEKYHDPDCGLTTRTSPKFTKDTTPREAETEGLQAAACCLDTSNATFDPNNPTLRQALDGLQAAQAFAANHDLAVGEAIAECYQQLGEAASADAWESHDADADADGGGGA